MKKHSYDLNRCLLSSYFAFIFMQGISCLLLLLFEVADANAADYESCITHDPGTNLADFKDALDNWNIPHQDNDWMQACCLCIARW